MSYASTKIADKIFFKKYRALNYWKEPKRISHKMHNIVASKRVAPKDIPIPFALYRRPEEIDMTTGIDPNDKEIDLKQRWARIKARAYRIDTMLALGIFH